jgi:putative hydrolase of the HAD superfamily
LQAGRVVIDAITFDLDGTLYDHKAARMPFMIRNMTRLRVARVGKQVREDLRGQEFASGAALLDEEARVAADRLDVDAAQAREMLHSIFNDSLVKVLAKLRDPHTRTLLHELAAQGVKLGVVSDRIIDAKLAALGLDDVPWAAKVSADDTGLLKPSPKPFLLACERMGVAPERALHVGDRDDMDGAGARAANMRFLLVGGPRDLEKARALIAP